MVSSYRLIQYFRADAIHRRQIGVQHDLLAADRQDSGIDKCKAQSR